MGKEDPVEAVSVLAVASSPRRNGNSERLLDELIAGARSIGANVEKAVLSDYRISPCTECGGCVETGKCVIDDDFQEFYSRYFSMDRIVLATPVFFMCVSAQAKTLIDRGQALWIRKYVLKQRITAREGFPRKGYLIATGGSGLPNTFDCSKTVAKCFYKTIDMEFADSLCVNRVDCLGEVDRHPEALKSAFELGMKVATA
jgi:multimeric flavodoxin WrbA